MLNHTTVFSVKDAEVALKADHAVCDVSDDLEKFISRNRDAVYFACNTWLQLMIDIGLPTGARYELGATIKACGLSTVVGICRAAADELLNWFPTVPLRGESHWQSTHSDDRVGRPVYFSLDYIAEELAESIEDLGRISLQFLLYLERFTYDGNTVQGKLSVDKYVAANKRCRDYEYNWDVRPGSALCGMMREALSEMITLGHFHFNEVECGFSSGSYTEAMLSTDPGPFKRSRLGKWVALSQYRAYLYHPMYPLPGCNNKGRSCRKPVLTLVPKTFASYRVIFPEDITMSYVAHGVLEAFRSMLKSNGTSRFINERDQSVNRELSRIGSASGEWATIDMSSASDSISKAMAFWVLPEWFKPYLLSVCSDSCVQYIGKRVVERKLFTLLTSGNPLTWIFQSVWFIAIGRVAASLCGAKSPELCVFSYGDDMVVRSEYYDTTVELLAAFGHTVNLRKSFCVGRFRESCGGWYYNSTDVTPTFWPRRVYPADKLEAYPVLIDLQHKAVSHGWGKVNTFLTEEILSRYPKVTTSRLNSEFNDLWVPDSDEYIDDNNPHSDIVEVKASAPKSALRLAELVAYTEYLAHGPLFESELDRLLGTSSSRLSRLTSYGSGKFRFTVRKA